MQCPPAYLPAASYFEVCQAFAAAAAASISKLPRLLPAAAPSAMPIPAGVWRQFWKFQIQIELIIDLPNGNNISELTVGFLNAQGSWIYLPESMLISYQLENGEWTKYTEVVIKEEYQKIDFKVKADKIKLKIMLYTFIQHYYVMHYKLTSWAEE